MKQSIDQYFQTARTWSDDIYLEALASRNRYRFAFFWSLLIISLLLVCFIVLLPLQSTQLMLVHQMDDGTSWVEPLKNGMSQPKSAQIESDIVRYVVNRESYSADAYDHQFSLVNLLSNKSTAKDYQNKQSASNPHSPINQFQHRIVRSVHVQNILFLKKDPNNPLAQVNFTIHDDDRLTGQHKKHSMLALISWRYRGRPKDPTSRWMNWDGFTVIHYSVQQRNLD